MIIRVKKNKLFFLIFLFLIFAVFAFAQDLEVRYPQFPGVTLPGEPTLPQFINYLYKLSIIIAGLVALFSLVYGGFRYLTSVGQPAAMADARDQISAGLVGLIILLGSYLFLVIINPQLAIFRLGAPQALRCTVDADCSSGQVCLNGVCAIIPGAIQLTGIEYRAYELPIGTLVKNLIESPDAIARLNTIASRADAIVEKSEAVKNKAEEFLAALNECSCSNANPSPPGCAAGGFCPAGLHCAGEVCPNREEIADIKEELKRLANEELAPAMESMLPPLTSLRKDKQKLDIAYDIFKEIIYPINYDSFLEIKQAINEIGREVKVIPFIVFGQRIRGLGDHATFYASEENISDLIASGEFPALPRFDTQATCNECNIPLHETNVDIPESIKQQKEAEFPGGGIRAPCPDGMDCWNYVINWAKSNGWNPVFILAMWEEESGFSTTGIALGCDPWRINEGTSPYTAHIVSQLECFTDSTAPGTGNCRAGNTCEAGNTEFCGFMRCWGSGPNSCILQDPVILPNFWPRYFDAYMSLIPTPGEGETSPAAPSGNCTTGGGAPLPPGLAGCPLDSTESSFGITCGWNGYPGHSGIDINADDGDPVYAIAEGSAYARGGDDEGCGIQVWLQTEFGLFVYCHLLDTAHITAGGVSVAKGDFIGRADTTGTSISGPHLHLEFHPGRTDRTNPYPLECTGTECIDGAPDLRPGICGDGPVSCP